MCPAYITAAAPVVASGKCIDPLRLKPRRPR
jgi:hypothetical protein